MLLYSVYRVRRCAISLARPLGAFAVPTLAQFVDGGSVVLAAWLEASRFGQPRGGAERERSDSAKVGPHGAHGPRMTIKLLAAEGYTTNCNPYDCGQSHVRMKRSRFQLGDPSGKPLDKEEPIYEHMAERRELSYWPCTSSQLGVSVASVNGGPSGASELARFVAVWPSEAGGARPSPR